MPTTIANTTPIDSIPAAESVHHNLSALSSLTLADFIDSLARKIVHLAFSILLALIVFYIGRFIIRRLHALVTSVMQRRQVDLSLQTFVLSMVDIGLYFILIVTVIGILGIETSSFIAIFASAGVALGMALSGTLQNFAGGVLILLLKPYRVGDYIEAQGYSGNVKAIQIFSTIITTPDNKTIIVPNGALSTGSLNNWSGQDYRRVDWDVSMSYDNSFAVAEKAILDILSQVDTIIKEPVEGETNVTGPSVVLNEMADSSVNLKVRAWVRKEDYWSVYYLINRRLFTELPEHGVSFPYPQLDVHLKQS